MLTKQLLKNFLTYSAGAVISRVLTASLTLATITIFTPATFGLLALFYSFLIIMPVFLNFGLRQVFELEFFHQPDNLARKKLLQELVFTYLIISGPVLILASLNLKLLNKILFMGQATNLAIILALIICWLSFFSELFYQVLRYQQQALKLTVVQILNALITTGLALLLVFKFKLEILGFLLATLASLILVCSYAGYLYLCQTRNSFSTKPHNTIKYLSLDLSYVHGECSAGVYRTIKYLKLGLPYVSNIIFTWILATSDRWFLAYWGSLELVGIFALADSFGQLFNLIIINPLIYSYIPYILNQFSQHRDQPEQLIEINQQNLKYMYWAISSLLILISLGWLIFKPALVYFIPQKYCAALNYILIILASQICLMGSYFATCYLQFQKRVYLQLGLIMGTAIIKVLLNILLIPQFQLYGCTLATLIAYGLYLWATIKITPTNHSI